MQVAAEIRRVVGAFSSDSNKVDMDDLKLEFTFGGAEESRSYLEDLTPDQKTAVSKIGWLTAVGMDPKIIRQAVEENLGPGGASHPLLEHRSLPPEKD
jgi:hypothetical protein